MEVTAPKKDPIQRAAELREGNRRANEDPSAIVDLSGDLLALAAEGKRLASFDATVTTGPTTVSYEVTRPDNVVKDGKDIYTGVPHATAKLAKRAKDGEKISGITEVTIQVTIPEAWDSKGAKYTIDNDGNRSMEVPGVKAKEVQGNVFSEFEKVLNRYKPDSLTRIVVVDEKGLRATFSHADGLWKKDP